MGDKLIEAVLWVFCYMCIIAMVAAILKSNGW